MGRWRVVGSGVSERSEVGAQVSEAFDPVSPHRAERLLVKHD
jgi:hypothetical protein